MATLKLEKQESIYVLTLINGENDNTFNDDVLLEYHDAFDRIEADRENAALLIQSSHEKTFCNGIDLTWMMTHYEEKLPDFMERLENFFIRLSVLNVPVVAAINGNCYASGAIMASACDFRIMREDKGRFCFSELKYKMPFTPGMLEVIQALPNKHSLWELALTSRAYGGFDCLRKQIVDDVCSIENLPYRSLKLAEDLAAKHRPTYVEIKRGLRPQLTALAHSRGLLHA